MERTPLHIPKPCHEDWGKMTQEEKGRHCALCNKVVVDFTEMPTEKVVEYVSTRTSEKICGKFRSDQVNLPGVNVSNYTYVGKMRVFLAALLLAFGSALFSSCNIHRHRDQHPQGGVRMQEFSPTKIDTPVKQNPNYHHYQGAVVMTRNVQTPVWDSPVKQDNDHPKGHVNIAPQNQPPAKDTM